MKVYKVYYLVNDEKVYLIKVGDTDFYPTLKGAKAAITYREKWHRRWNEQPTKYYIEEYKCELCGVTEIN